jgi:hypothetical protein
MSSARYVVNHDELQSLRELLERGREPAPKISMFRKTVLLIKSKFARPSKPPVPQPETKKKDAA